MVTGLGMALRSSLKNKKRLLRNLATENRIMLLFMKFDFLIIVSWTGIAVISSFMLFF
jgi:hypothetical protein